jgi:hypothetical protein
LAPDVHLLNDVINRLREAQRLVIVEKTTGIDTSARLHAGFIVILLVFRIGEEKMGAAHHMM